MAFIFIPNNIKQAVPHPSRTLQIMSTPSSGTVLLFPEEYAMIQHSLIEYGGYRL